MGGGDGGINGCAVGGGLLGVCGTQKPNFLSIWDEERLRNGCEPARETHEFWPRSRPALFLKVINDRVESHWHRTRHRGGRALLVTRCPQGRSPQRSTLSRRCGWHPPACVSRWRATRPARGMYSSTLHTLYNAYAHIPVGGAVVWAASPPGPPRLSAVRAMLTFFIYNTTA